MSYQGQNMKKTLKTVLHPKLFLIVLILMQYSTKPYINMIYNHYQS